MNKFPLYSRQEIDEVTCEIKVYPTQFNTFLENILFERLTESSEEEEVVSFALTNGTYTLNANQTETLNLIVGRFPNRCLICHGEQDWAYRADIKINEGVCGLCLYHKDRDDIKEFLKNK